MTNSTKHRFRIVFAKLEEAKKEQPALDDRAQEASPREIDEIDRLRRMVLEVTESEPTSYTTT